MTIPTNKSRQLCYKSNDLEVTAVEWVVLLYCMNTEHFFKFIFVF